MVWKKKAKTSNKKRTPKIKAKRKSKKIIVYEWDSGTMTSIAFWGMIRNALRNRSRFWKSIAMAKQLAKRKYTGPNKKQRFEYQCNECKGWFSDKEVAVDHIVEAGKLRCLDDLLTFVPQLFCNVDNLQVLCDPCHNIKTQIYRVKLKEDKKNEKIN